MEDVGGLREFAGIVSDHLKNAPDGSVQKGRAIDVMTRLVDKHTKSEEEAEPLAVKDEGDLHRMLEEKLLLLAQRNGLRIVVNPVDGTDGSEQEKTEGTAASPAPS
jgi:putative aminopeptidase FrvX